MLTLNPAYISAQSQENSSKVAPSPNGSFEAKGSRFLGFLVLVREFESVLKTLKATHLKAVHFVYAYRELLPNGQILERSSDDGEPKGSSGISVLNVLRGWEMIDCGVIVVRYFGGTLLGIGGLVRALDLRAGAALMLLALVADSPVTIQDFWMVERGYDNVIHVLKSVGVKISSIIC